jgi:hypothetical protein
MPSRVASPRITTLEEWVELGKRQAPMTPEAQAAYDRRAAMRMLRAIAKTQRVTISKPALDGTLLSRVQSRARESRPRRNVRSGSRRARAPGRLSDDDEPAEPDHVARPPLPAEVAA